MAYSPTVESQKIKEKWVNKHNLMKSTAPGRHNALLLKAQFFPFSSFLIGIFVLCSLFLLTMDMLFRLCQTKKKTKKTLTSNESVFVWEDFPVEHPLDKQGFFSDLLRVLLVRFTLQGPSLLSSQFRTCSLALKTWYKHSRFLVKSRQHLLYVTLLLTQI